MAVVSAVELAQLDYLRQRLPITKVVATDVRFNQWALKHKIGGGIYWDNDEEVEHRMCEGSQALLAFQGCSPKLRTIAKDLGLRVYNIQRKIMIDPDDREIEAMAACVGPLAEYVTEVGMQKPLADYSRAQIDTMIRVVIGAYFDAKMSQEIPF